MSNRLANSVFTTSADEELAAVDVYQQDGSDYASGSTTEASNQTDLNGFINSSESSSVSSDGLDLSSNSLSVAVLDDFPEIKSSFTQLDTNIQKQLLSCNGFEEIKILDTSNIGALPQQSIFSSSKNISALVKLAGSISSTNGLKSINVAASAQFLSNLVNVSVLNGIPNMYAKIDSAGYDTSIMSRVTMNSLNIAVRTGNLNLLMNLANGSMSGNIRSMYPNFPASFAAGFRLDSNMKPQFYGQIASSISTSFGKIDVNWAKTPYGNTFNGRLFLNSSRDFRTVASASVGYANRPFNNGYTTNTSIVSSLPGVGVLGLGVRGKEITVNGSAQFRYDFPNGGYDVYSKQTDNTYSKVSNRPIPLFNPNGAIPPGNDSDFYSLDNSQITDPMVFGGLLCRQQDYSKNTTAFGTRDSLNSLFPLFRIGG